MKTAVLTTAVAGLLVWASWANIQAQQDAEADSQPLYIAESPDDCAIIQVALQHLVDTGHMDAPGFASNHYPESPFFYLIRDHIKCYPEIENARYLAVNQGWFGENVVRPGRSMEGRDLLQSIERGDHGLASSIHLATAVGFDPDDSSGISLNEHGTTASITFGFTGPIAYLCWFTRVELVREDGAWVAHRAYPVGPIC